MTDFSNLFDGWSHLFSSQQEPEQNKQQEKRHSYYPESYYSSVPPSTISEEEEEEGSSTISEDIPRRFPKRKNSVKLGRQVLSELLDNHNVANAIHILKQALEHLNMTQQGQENSENISKVYSDILRSLCDPQIAEIVDEMSLTKDGKIPDVEHSIMWRLFNKVAESGHVLERDANLAVVDTLVEKHRISLALQAMYTLPRKDWDTRCYHAAVLLHLMHDPIQVQEAQGLVSDYGKPYLEIANPIAPDDLPPIRMPMPLMEDVTEHDRIELLQFYQDTLEANDREWHDIRVNYEQTREQNIQKLNDLNEGIAEWALNQLNIETSKQQLDRIISENDNNMIKVSMERSQFIYGWKVYEAMGDAVNEHTPYVVMHMCWVAFDKTPAVDISRRLHWEKHAFSVYSRFMLSEYLHPEQKETPDFLHDILSIVSQSPEILIDKKARYTKSMSIYQLLVRLELDTLLCDERVLDPILCTLLSYHYQDMEMIYNKAFEIWERKLHLGHGQKTSHSMLWGLFVFCLNSGQTSDFYKVIQDLFIKDRNAKDIPSSLLAPIQVFHDLYLCEGCYFYDYMFQFVQYTDDENAPLPISMDQYGFIHQDDTEDLITNINEIQAKPLGMSVLMGVSKQEKLVSNQMYYSTKKAKALIRHCLMKSKKE